MGIVTHILGTIGERPELAAATDPLPLTSEERASAHFSAVTRGGRRIRISLPRGTELQDGDVLAFESGVAVVVEASEEELLHLRPGDDTVEWAAACYQLGNLHRPARFSADGILTPVDPMAQSVLGSFRISVERVRRPFVGRRYGAVGSSHGHHHHTHGDDHHHSHPHPAGHGHGH